VRAAMSEPMTTLRYTLDEGVEVVPLERIATLPWAHQPTGPMTGTKDETPITLDFQKPRPNTIFRAFPASVLVHT
jgi:hypothetical protein